MVLSRLCSGIIIFGYSILYFFFFFNDTATTEIYTLSLHDALPICPFRILCFGGGGRAVAASQDGDDSQARGRSEEHTSELQSPCNLVCRLLLEKKKKSTPLTCNNTICSRSAHNPTFAINHTSSYCI